MIKETYIQYCLRKVLTGGISAVLIVTCSACSTPIGDRLLGIVDSPNANGQDKTILVVQRHVDDLIRQLELPPDKKQRFASINLTGIVRSESRSLLNNVHRQLIIIEGDVNLMSVTDSIILSRYPVKLAYSANNIVISSDDVNISGDGASMFGDNDGRWAQSSLVIARGAVKATGIRGTAIYAERGVKDCSDCGDVWVCPMQQAPIWKR